jgi:hypothetical protein
MLYPYNLSFDYSYECIKLVRAFGDARNALSVSFYVALWAWLRAALRNDAVAVAFAFFLMPFLPLSNLFVAVGTTIAERLCFMPYAE